MATSYRIYPSIGIARLGEDENFFLGPETPGAGPTEMNGQPVTQFKNGTKNKIRKQGARFHLFESSDGGKTWRPADLPAGSQVIWRVTLANKKSAVNRDVDPPKVPTRPTIAAANAGRIIDGGTKEISGAGATSGLLVGRYATTAANGSAYSVDVELGRLRTDGARRLIVCGGRGFSSAPPGTPIGDENAGESYYKNPNWHDDVADGPVDALVKLPGVAPVAAENSAWVIVAPPDFAPAVDGVITLYDDLRQLSFDHFGVAAPGTPSFDLEIQPIINRVRRLQWVHSNHLWQNPALNDPDLRSKDASKKTKRNDALTKFILKVEGALSGDVPLGGPVFRFLKFQRAMLDAWAAGNFDDTPAPVPSGFSAEGLTRSALEAAVGQRFWPGIEGGIILLDPSLYIRPFDFRIDHASVKAGDITALMAQPWQADFLKCARVWWPTQRPDIAPQAAGAPLPWTRGVDDNDHQGMVDNFQRLGFIVKSGPSEVFVEAERDPNFAAGA